MFKFIQDALTELEHVVWPTPTETKKYMTYTVGVIIVLATALALTGQGIRLSLTNIRESVQDRFPSSNQTIVSGSGNEYATDEYLDSVLDAIEKKKAASGATTETGAITVGTGTAQ